MRETKNNEVIKVTLGDDDIPAIVGTHYFDTLAKFEEWLENTTEKFSWYQVEYEDVLTYEDYLEWLCVE